MKNLSVVLWVIAALCFPVFAQLRAANEIKLHTRLVWGTDNEKPNDPKLKDLDTGLKERFKGVFKWKYYFEVNNQKVAVSSDAPLTVTMSPKCKIEIQNLGESMVEVKLFGDGKMVVKKRQALKAGQPLVLAGDTKNDTAWFVVLSAD